ncbi:MAG TPA: 2,3-diaminopropionate biosynthesis protein SbnA [Pseudonocardiaceae bacterium]
MPGEGAVGILSTIGRTPLVRLDRLFPGMRSQVFAKLERFNPGGSVKDRPALEMVAAQVRSGRLVPGRSVVVESSSGNVAVGLAQVCAYHGLRFVCVTDARVTTQNLAILRALGAEVHVLTEPDPRTGEFLPARLRRVRELLATVPHAWSPDQYRNPLNALAHTRTMAEIAEALDGRVDYLFCATGTCGTLRGCADHVRAAGLRTRVVAVDAVGSVIFGGAPAPRLVPGHGASVVPPLAHPMAADEVMRVSDLDCVIGCRRLVAREAILAGGSSGACVAAFGRRWPTIPPGATSVLIFPDGGDRYLDTIYSDEWVAEHFGEVSRLWTDAA